MIEVLLYSDGSKLSLHSLKAFVEKGWFVHVIALDKKPFLNLNFNNNLKIYSLEDVTPNINYAFASFETINKSLFAKIVNDKKNYNFKLAFFTNILGSKFKKNLFSFNIVEYVYENFDNLYLDLSIKFLINSVGNDCLLIFLTNENFKKENKIIKTPSSFIQISLMLIIWLIITPYLFLLLGKTVATSSFKHFESGDINKGLSSLSNSNVFATLAKRQLSVYTKIPFLGVLFNQAYSSSQVLDEISSLATKSESLYENMLDLATSYNLLDTIQKKHNIFDIESRLSFIIDRLSFLLADLKKPKWENFNDEIQSLSNFHNTLVSYKEIIANASDLLGFNKTKTYLVLLQNNLEIRPTGGYLGNFMLVTFQNGSIIELPIYNVYKADENLVGFVESPLPIKKYLGDQTWFMRDSNWDPDFALSAEKAIWFIDKELDRSIDGVISIDIEFAKKLLNKVGQININSQGISINVTSENLYETILNYNDSKSLFINEFYKELILSLEKTNLKIDFLLNLISESAKNKNLQIYLKANSNLELALSRLKLDGKINPSECIDCDHLWVIPIEANLGANNANYFVSRNISLNTIIFDNYIDNILSVGIDNQLIGEGGLDYNNYLRFYLPLSAEDISINLSKNFSYEKLNLDIEKLNSGISVGTYIVTEKGKVQTINLSWKQKLKTNNLALYVRKQPGILPFNISLKVVKGEDVFKSLTHESILRYNTLLSEDYYKIINLK